MIMKKIALVMFVLLLQSTYGAQICKARIDCPGNYQNDTVQVAENVVALTNKFFHCAPDSVDEGYSGRPADTISVFFVIDHSGSMSYMDSTGLRYRIVKNLIDTLAKISPASEIGMAVFSNQLLHNYQDDPFFVQLYPKYHDSYVPLTKLNSSVSGMSAVDKLKWSIELSTQKDFGGNYTVVNGDYSPTGRLDTLGNNNGYNGTTDISLSFEATRKAFLSASYPKQNHYVVFLSDGISQRVDSERAALETDYISGQGMPATFTAYFINVNKPIPAQISTMTENIKNNGYSSRNPVSTVWKSIGTENELVNKLLGQFSVGNGTQYFSSKPLSLTINGISATKFDDSLAYFPIDIPLTGDLSQLSISYTWRWNLPLNREQTATYTTIVRRSSDPDLISTECFEQGTLKFFYQGSEVSYIQNQQKTIEVRFYPPEGITSENVKIKVANATGSDSVIVTAHKSGDYYTGTFNREYNTPKNDAVLQNAFKDSLVAVYRNPDLPLDTIRIAAAVSEPRDIVVKSAYYLDLNGNGQPDVIRVVQGSEKLSAAEDSIVKGYLSIQTSRSLSVKDVVSWESGFDIVLNEQQTSTQNVSTGLYPGERLYIERIPGLPGGGELPQTDVLIADSMAPVILSAIYYDQANTAIRDTLVVNFSESIGTITHEQPFILKSISGGVNYKIRLESTLNQNSTVTFSVLPIIGPQSPKKGDSLNINYEAGVKDLINNVQDNPLNLQRDLGYYLLYNIQNAIYLDNDGDGLIDLVKVGMDVMPDSSLLSKLYETVQLPPHREFAYSRNDFSITTNGFEIKVQQPESMVPNTAVDEKDVLRVGYTEAANGSVIKETNVMIADSMAPVLISAKYIPGNGGGSVRTDSLIAVFSENTAVTTSERPFTFIQPNTGLTYTMILQYAGQKSPSEHVFSIKDVIGKELPEVDDSVYVNPHADIRDIKGNIQNSENRRSELLFGSQRIEYKIVSYPTPFNPQNAKIPGNIKEYYGLNVNEGLVLIVEPVSAGYLKLSGEMIIYDAAGNKVADKIYGREIARTKGLSFVWSGMTRKGRLAGTGIYLTEFKIKESKKTNNGYEETLIVQRFKIAVKHSVSTGNYYELYK